MNKVTRALALGFVIYRPEASLLDRVQRAAEAGFEVYIFDNSPQQELVRNICSGKQRVHYFTCGKNLGLGVGVSFVCAQAYYQSHTTLLFFDQDTNFSEETLDFIESFYLNRPELQSTHSAVAFDASSFGKAEPRECFKKVPLVINSGSMFFLKNVMTIGWHSEKYFVDGVDYEFCLRSKIRGFQIGKFSCTPGFDHSSEQADREYQIFGKSYAMRAYSLSRIVDVAKSSLKLIFAATIGGEFKFASNIVRLWAIYLVVQILVRFLNMASAPEGVK
jgi:rhamnosyltransferase